MLFPIYNTLILLLTPLLALGILLRWRRRVLKRGLENWSERWGYVSDAQRQLFAMGHRWWWVHAVSLGELKAIERFLRRAPQHAGVRIVLSVVTPEALAWAREKHLADEIIAAPIDFPWVVRRAFKTIHPEWFITVESEFWPNLLREARRSGARVALINGRISERSFRRYRWIRWLLGGIWEQIHLFAVREEEDARRFRALGVPTDLVRVVGHMKYDIPLQPPFARTVVNDPVLVFGSTREGEEEALTPVVETLRAQWPTLRVIWAPRHVDRVPQIEKWLHTHAWESERRSSSATLAQLPLNLLWDTFGNLLEAYKLADVAVIGGSYVGKGGQNPLEPAALGKPVVFGPSMENFRDIAEALVQTGGAKQVSLQELGPTLTALLQQTAERQRMADQAHALLARASGATERTLLLLETSQ